jgi:hypothetical protein
MRKFRNETFVLRAEYIRLPQFVIPSERSFLYCAGAITIECSTVARLQDINYVSDLACFQRNPPIIGHFLNFVGKIRLEDRNDKKSLCPVTLVHRDSVGTLFSVSNF